MKRHRLPIAILLLLVATVATGLYVRSLQPPRLQARPYSSPFHVYVTRTGQKYHRAGCQYLYASSREILLSTAQRQKYAPCKVCDPPR